MANDQMPNRHLQRWANKRIRRLQIEGAFAVVIIMAILGGLTIWALVL